MKVYKKLELPITMEEWQILIMIKPKKVDITDYLRSCFRVSLFELRQSTANRINVKLVAKKIEDLEAELAKYKETENKGK